MTMLADIKAKAANRTPDVLAVDGAVMDWVYPAGAGHPYLKNRFLSNLRELVAESGGQVSFAANPSAGEMRSIAAEDLDAALSLFADKCGWVMAGSGIHGKAETIRHRLFGVPEAQAGGSLANTFHALVRSKLDGVPLVKGHYVTGVGRGAAGEMFAQSLDSNIYARTYGRQTECHVIPFKNDRIMLTTHSRDESANVAITGELVRAAGLTGRDRIMIGGFMLFAPGFYDVSDVLMGHTAAQAPDRRPVFVLTTATPAISGQTAFRDCVLKAASLTPTIVHANAEEFHALLGDAGRSLDARAVKQRLSEMFGQAAAQLRFVVTDGPSRIAVITAGKIENFRPHKVDPAQIVNTVGAGDNAAAGFQLGDLYGLPHGLSVWLARDFSRDVICTSGPRLDEGRVVTARMGTCTYDLGGALASLDRKTLTAMRWGGDKPRI